MRRHEASSYLLDHVLPVWGIAHLNASMLSTLPPLNHFQAASVSRGLRLDASSYYFSALISLADGLNGVTRRYYTWATVKLYYSVFYALRGLLALDDVAIFYSSSRPFIVKAQSGARIEKVVGGRKAGTTHGAIFETFKARNPGHYLLSQDIDNEMPLGWLESKRNEANYTNACFFEPSCPEYFNQVARYGVRRLLSEYMGNPSIKYEFDPDHAMVAFPLKLLQTLRGLLSDNDLRSLSAERVALSGTLFRDDDGPLPVMGCLAV